MSSYVDNHLRIWGKDAKAFMKAAAGEEMGRGQKKRPVAFDPYSIRPIPKKLMPALLRQRQQSSYQKDLNKWREANWTVDYIFDCCEEWSLLDKQSGSHPMVPFAKEKSGQRLDQYPGKVWYINYQSPFMPPYKLLRYIGKTWDIQLENFFDDDGYCFCGVYGSKETRTGNFTMDHLVEGTGRWNEISYESKDGAYQMDFGDLPAGTWEKIDEIKKAIHGLDEFNRMARLPGQSGSESGDAWIEDPKEWEFVRWVRFEDRRKRSLEKGNGKLSKNL